MQRVILMNFNVRPKRSSVHHDQAEGRNGLVTYKLPNYTDAGYGWNAIGHVDGEPRFGSWIDQSDKEKLTSSRIDFA